MTMMVAIGADNGGTTGGNKQLEDGTGLVVKAWDTADQESTYGWDEDCDDPAEWW